MNIIHLIREPLRFNKNRLSKMKVVDHDKFLHQKQEQHLLEKEKLKNEVRSLIF